MKPFLPEDPFARDDAEVRAMLNEMSAREQHDREVSEILDRTLAGDELFTELFLLAVEDPRRCEGRLDVMTPQDLRLIVRARVIQALASSPMCDPGHVEPDS
jgi:hypothetical protein